MEFSSSNGTDYRGGRPRSNSSSRATGRGYRNNRVPSGQRKSESSENPRPWNVFDILLRSYNGKTFLSNIRGLFPKSMLDTEIKDWFESDKGKRFTVFTDALGRISLIAVCCRGKLCLQYGQHGCTRENCTYFHLCRYFLSGHCSNGVQCKYAHHFQDEHNKEMVMKYSLAKYNEQELKTILMMSIPQVCNAYNNKSCKFNHNCICLHICEDFVMNGTCSDNDCNLDHTFTSNHTQKLIEIFQLQRLTTKEHVLRKCILINQSDKRKQHPRDGTSDNTERPRSTPNRGHRRGGARGGRSASKSRNNSSSYEATLVNSTDNDESKQYDSVDTKEYIPTGETWAGPITSYSPQYKKNVDTDASVSKKIHPHQIDLYGSIATSSEHSNEATSFDRKMKDVQLHEERRIKSTSLLDIKKKLQLQRTSNAEIERRQPLRGDAYINNELHGQQPGRKEYDGRVAPRVRSNKLTSDLDQNLRYKYKEDYGAAGAGYTQKYGNNSYTSDMNKDSICFENLTRQCFLGQRCPHFHSDKPYAWHIKLFDHWYQIDERQERILEEYYCNPNKDSEVIQLQLLNALDEPLKMSINFNLLNATAHDGNYSLLPIKRRCISSTIWLWYQKKDGHYDSLSPNMTAALEKQYASYIKDADSAIFRLGSSSGTEWLIDFKNMKLKIVKPEEGNFHELKRRPQINQ